ncbi:type II toxin-antitoxin system HicB family antitoxin [Azospirillum sp. sgz301742]
MRRYVATLHHSDSGGWGISFPDFPGCISGADSYEGALRMGAEALDFHVRGMLEDGDPIPEPHDEATLRADPEFTEDFEEAVVALVPLTLPETPAARRAAGSR